MLLQKNILKIQELSAQQIKADYQGHYQIFKQVIQNMPGFFQNIIPLLRGNNQPTTNDLIQKHDSKILDYQMPTQRQLSKHILKTSLLIKLNTLTKTQSISKNTLERLISLYNSNTFIDIKYFRYITDKDIYKPYLLYLKKQKNLEFLKGQQYVICTGYSVGLAIALFKLQEVRVLLKTLEQNFSLTLQYFYSSSSIFLKKLHELKNHQGSVTFAQNVKNLIEQNGQRSQNYKIRSTQKGRVQDPYSIRCMPQVIGITIDTLNYVENQMLKMTNNCGMQPFIIQKQIFPNLDNGEHLLQLIDQITPCISQIGSITQIRTYRMLTDGLSLCSFPFDVSSYLSSLVSQNKRLCNPASSDSITCDGFNRDMVCEIGSGLQKMQKVIKNVGQIVRLQGVIGGSGLSKVKRGKSTQQVQKILQKIKPNEFI